MPEESTEERQVRHFFEHVGYEVERLSTEAGSKTADFLITRPGERHLVEVKSRAPDEDFARQLDEHWRAESEQPMARTNVLSGRVRDAVKQLKATSLDDASVGRLMAFVAADDDPDLHVDQFKKTLYGIVELATERHGAASALPCFYFTYSEFFRFPILDGAVALSRRGGRLCVNDRSPRHHLADSALYAAMQDADALDDPTVLEPLGQAYIADTGISRDDPTAVLEYVREKYGRPELLPFEPTRIRVARRVAAEHTGPQEREQ